MLPTVRQLMTANPETLPPTATMQEAIELEMRRRIRHIPVVEDGALVGIVTDRDLKRATPSVLSGVDRAEYERVVAETPLGRVMTRDPMTVSPDTSLRAAVQVFVERKYGALPVVEDGRLVGILTESDVMRAFVALLDRFESRAS